MPSGHHLLKAKLNGQKGLFILDTGASNTCVDQAQADRFNLKGKDTDHKATGAGNGEIDIQLSNKNKLKIGDWKIKKIPLVLMDLSHINTALQLFDIEIDGIIGADVLHQGKGIIQYEKELLFLK
ncbi:MAG TPA: acid protease [Flavobacteriales bacterium]|nr:acid protease [Flavobacteriales bacterium]